MDYAVVYYWWANNDLFPWQDLANPIIWSIATLRFVNQDIAVYVVDVSDRPHDWGDLPSLLRFEVIHTKSLFRPTNVDKRLLVGLMAKIFDISEAVYLIPEQKVIVCDADILWLKNPLPLAMEKDGELDHLYASGNTGVWYFDKENPEAKMVLDLWRTTSEMTVKYPCFIDVVQKIVPVPGINEEVMMSFVTRSMQLGHPIPLHENFLFREFAAHPARILVAKNLHVMGHICGRHRGRIAFLLEEFYAATKLVPHIPVTDVPRFSLYTMSPTQIIELVGVIGGSKFELNKTIPTVMLEHTFEITVM